MYRRFVVASAIAVVLTGACLTGFGSSAVAARGAQRVPAGLAAAIHARLGAGAIRSTAAGALSAPDFGYSVALAADGKTALVGADNAGRLSTVFGTCCGWRNGEAFVFHVSGEGFWSSTHTPAATLRPGHAATFGFGNDVALSADGTTAFVAAPSNGGTGVVYVFHVSAAGAWASSSTPTATLTVGGSTAELGSLALSSDGTTLVADGGGQAVIFHVLNEGAWATTSTPAATLTAGGPAAAISGDGTTVLVSDAANYLVGGGAFVYHVAADDAWTSSTSPTATLTDANAETGMGSSDALGISLALSGDGTVALLGSSDGNSSGYVDVFRASGEAEWATTSTTAARLTRAGSAEDDDFGAGMAVSTDGTTALVSAPGTHGGAYIFHVSAAGAWASTSAPTATLSNSSDRAGDVFGFEPTLSADGATALVGAPGARLGIGAADIFHVSGASSWASSSTPAAILTASALNQCMVPKLKGLKVAAAKSALKARRCRLGSVRRVVHAQGKRGRVFYQSRKLGSRWPVGTKVNVKVRK
jgi:hypothetical protein